MKSNTNSACSFRCDLKASSCGHRRTLVTRKKKTKPISKHRFFIYSVLHQHVVVLLTQGPKFVDATRRKICEKDKKWNKKENERKRTTNRRRQNIFDVATDDDKEIPFQIYGITNGWKGDCWLPSTHPFAPCFIAEAVSRTSAICNKTFSISLLVTFRRGARSLHFRTRTHSQISWQNGFVLLSLPARFTH